MTTTARGLSALTASAVLTLGAWTLSAQEPARDPAARPDNPPAGTTERIKRGFGSAIDSVKESFSKVKGSASAMGVHARVYSRLHWDKSLYTADINTDVSREGLVTLRGSVADAKAKARAVDLARETVGVTGVTDELTIRPVTTTTDPAPDPAPAAKP